MFAAMLLLPAMSLAYAETYFGNIGLEGETGANTLEETLKLAQKRVEATKENPGLGSGTPFMALDGAVGASVISAGIFGGLAAVFFVKSREGRYAKQGRG